MSSALCSLASWYGFLSRSYYSFKLLRDGRAFEGEKGRRRSLRGGLEEVLKQRQREEDVKEALQFWTLFALCALYEYYLEFLFAWLPLYYVVKFVGMLYVIAPRTRGASFLFEQFEPRLLEKVHLIEDRIIPAILSRLASLVIRVNSSLSLVNEAKTVAYLRDAELNALERRARDCLAHVANERARRRNPNSLPPAPPVPLLVGSTNTPGNAGEPHVTVGEGQAKGMLADFLSPANATAPNVAMNAARSLTAAIFAGGAAGFAAANAIWNGYSTSASARNDNTTSTTTVTIHEEEEEEEVEQRAEQRLATHRTNSLSSFSPTTQIDMTNRAESASDEFIVIAQPIASPSSSPTFLTTSAVASTSAAKSATLLPTTNVEVRSPSYYPTRGIIASPPSGAPSPRATLATDDARSSPGKSTPSPERPPRPAEPSKLINNARRTIDARFNRGLSWRETQEDEGQVEDEIDEEEDLDRTVVRPPENEEEEEEPPHDAADAILNEISAGEATSSPTKPISGTSPAESNSRRFSWMSPLWPFTSFGASVPATTPAESPSLDSARSPPFQPSAGLPSQPTNELPPLQGVDEEDELENENQWQNTIPDSPGVVEVEVEMGDELAPVTSASGDEGRTTATTTIGIRRRLGEASRVRQEYTTSLSSSSTSVGTTTTISGGGVGGGVGGPITRSRAKKNWR